LDKLLNQVAFGSRDPNVISSIAGRLARLDRQITKEDRAALDAAAGMPLKEIVAALIDALDPDQQHLAAQHLAGNTDPTPEQQEQARAAMLEAALVPIATNPAFRTQLVEFRRSYEQAIDITSIDTVISVGPTKGAEDRARGVITSFKAYIEEHKDEITALQVLYSTPYRERLTFAQIKELATAIAAPPHRWTPEALWQAHHTLDHDKVHGSGTRMLTDLVSIVRYTLQQADELVPYQDIVEERYAGWLLAQQQAGRTFTPEQHQWLGMIKDHIAGSLEMRPDDFDFVPFSEHGGLGKATRLFGAQLRPIIDELRQALVA
jgi:type I restriction enzyme R subunit